MIPGFLALGAASLVIPSRHRSEHVLLRVAGAGVVLAGLFRCSDVRCPDPTKDPDATAADTAHAIVSLVSFAAWTVLPFVDARHQESSSSCWITVANGVVTAIGFVAAGLTHRLDHPDKGIAQRAFLGSVFVWYVTGAVRRLSRPSDR